MKPDESQHTRSQPDPGKARIYFIHDAGTNWTTGYPTVKIAVDGTWAGANHGNSYFPISVDPGEHHVCATLQSSLVAQRMELTHLTAASETVYYYRTRLILSRGVELLELDSIDNDQGRYLIAYFPLSVSGLPVRGGESNYQAQAMDAAQTSGKFLFPNTKGQHWPLPAFASACVIWPFSLLDRCTD